MWQLDERIPSCDFCADKFWPMLEAKHGHPPCFACKFPELWPENIVAWQCFQISYSQMRVVGMGTPLGIEFSAIDRAIELFGVHPDDHDTVFRKVNALGNAHAAKLREKQDSDNRSKGRKSTKSDFAPPPMLPAFKPFAV